MKRLLMLLMLSASAHAEVYVDWVRLPDDKLQEVCNGPLKAGDKSTNIAFSGCFRMVGPICRVYTRKPDGSNDADIHSTLGHEVRHCFQGYFH